MTDLHNELTAADIDRTARALRTIRNTVRVGALLIAMVAGAALGAVIAHHTGMDIGGVARA